MATAKPKALPKSIAACADLLFIARQKRLEADKVAAGLKAEEQRIIDYIIDNLDKDSTGAIGKTHKVRIITEEIPQLDPENLEPFYKWVAKTGAWDVLQKRLTKEAVMARFEYDKNGKIKKMPPGIKLFTAKKVSLTKAGS